MEQNKIRTYLLYAIGEIALVMIGILLALQVNNWNESRKAREMESSIIADIHEEFSKNSEQLNYIVTRHQKLLNSANWLLDNYPDYDVEVDSMLFHLEWANSAFTFNPSQSAVQAIINTSSFNLIGNNDLRQKLILWSDLYIDYYEDEEVSSEMLKEFLLPYMKENGDYSFLMQKNDLPKSIDLTPYQTLEFKNLLIIRVVAISIVLDSPEQELQRLKQVIQDILELTAQD